MQWLARRSAVLSRTSQSKRQFSVLRSFGEANGLTDDQLTLQEMARSFSEKEFKPYAKQWDEEKFFPYEALLKGAELGFGGLFVREESGGTGLSRVDGSIIFEELATGCTSTTAYITIHNMCCWMIDNYGNESQRKKYLPKLVSMEHCASYCLTEPSHGSDAGNLKTTAKEEGDYLVLNGSKAFISGGGRSEIYVVMVRTGGPGPKGISCVVVEKDTPGLSFGSNEKKLGWNSQPTAAVIFENCKIPKENVIGNVGEGFAIAMQGLQGGRINIGACSLGAAKACLDVSTNYVKERKQFGAPLMDLQSVQFKLANMASQLHVSRLAIREAAGYMDAGKKKEANIFCALAKKQATDAGFMICNESLQLLGGYGYLKDFPVERYLRDCRVHQILEGTNEIMNLIVARDVLS